jgi:hypothetical protein
MMGIVNEGSYTLMLFKLSKEENGKLDTSTHLKYFITWWMLYIIGDQTGLALLD